MNINFKAALATLCRALPLILFRAAIFVAGGFMVIILFAMLLFAFRLAGGVSPFVAAMVIVPALLSWWVGTRILQYFFLYRQRAAMLLLFSGWKPPTPGLTTANKEASRFFPDHSRWSVIKRDLRRVLSAFCRGNGDFSLPPAAPSNWGFLGVIDLLATGPLSQAILVLALSRNGMNLGRSIRESLALYFRHGHESRRLSRQWLMFSAAGLIFLFLCLALPNSFFFRSAGAPVWIGIALAAAIAWLLHQAFIIPLVLAGTSNGLFTETCGQNPDPALCEKLSPLFPDTTSTR